MLGAIIDLSCPLMNPRLPQVFESKNARAIKRFGTLHWNLCWHGCSNTMPVSHLPIMVHAIHGVPELNVSQSPTSVTNNNLQDSNKQANKQASKRCSEPDR
ncbi:hypothetical protein FALCPG4_009529 [Fusarium falciforme]